MNAQKYAGAAWPVALVVLTTIYGYWAVQRELVSSRPSTAGQYDVPDPVPSPGVRTTHSRMWGDPLSKAYTDWKGLSGNERGTDLKTFQDSEKLRKHVKGAVENAAATNFKNKVRDFLQSLSLKDAVHPSKRVDILTNEMKEFFRDLVLKQPTICMPVFVPGGPYAEDKETRIRIRYAVVTALAESGYHYKYPRRMSYVVPRIYIRVLRGWQEREVVVPVKLYRHDDGQRHPQVLVIWVNESELGMLPLLATHRVLNAIFEKVTDPTKLQVSIIGPASSDMLKEMKREINDLNDLFYAKAIREANTANQLADDFTQADGIKTEFDNNRTQLAYLAINEAAKSIQTKAAALLVDQAVEESEAADEVVKRAADSIKTDANMISDGVIRQAAEKMKLRAIEIKKAPHKHISTKAKEIQELANRICEAVNKNRLANCGDCRAIQRTANNVKQKVEDLKEAKGDEAKIQRTADSIKKAADKIKIAEAYELIKQTAGRIEKGATNISDKPGVDRELAENIGEDAKILAKKAYEVIKRTAGNIDPSDGWHHWYIASYGPRVKRTQGFLPLLSPLENGVDATQIFSSRATKDGVAWPQNRMFTLHRVIGTDRALAIRLRKELKLRGVVPGTIALITEHDTAYGRSFPPMFASVLSDDATDVLWFRILRGIDGKQPGDEDDADGSPRASRRKPSGDLPEIAERPPAGRTQYDYLRRLARKIERLGDVDAVGVVGSDVYDKLLVLRALKPRLPNCVFFTTDLDAIYGHPDERRHTRNLLIASHFDLRLGNQLQRETPPFRDSYQTATFLATRLAVQRPNCENGLIRETDPWKPVMDHWFGDNRDVVGVKPVFHVVGRAHIQRLTDFDSMDNEQEVEASLHPKLSHRTGAWRYLFVAGFPLVAGCLAWVFIRRERSHDSRPPTAEGHMPWAGGMRICLVILFGMGLLLFVGFCFRGFRGEEAASFFGGYSTWPTKTLYTVTGILGVLAMAYIVDQFRFRLAEISQQEKQLGVLASNCFREAHLVKIAILALVILYAGGVIAYEHDSPRFWVPASVTICGFGVAWWYCRRSTRESDGSILSPAPASDEEDETAPRDFVLGTDLRASFGYAVLAMIGVTLIAVLGERLLGGSPVGWHPASTSRGWPAHIGDRLAVVYAFGSVGLLLSALLYLHLWCREFARYAKNYRRAPLGMPHGMVESPDENEELKGRAKIRAEFGEDTGNGEDRAEKLAESAGEDSRLGEVQNEVAKNEYDRLWTIGKLTSVPCRVALVLMALLFMLLIAYHPRLSPVPMPLSLLVLTSASVIVFIVSAVSLRWHFDNQREEALSELQLKLWELREATEANLQPPETQGEGERPHRQEFHKREEELPTPDEAPADQAAERAPSTGIALPKQDRHREPVTKQLKALLTIRKEQIEALSEGVFRPWNRSPMGWILGGGAMLALVDLWVRWWTISL